MGIDWSARLRVPGINYCLGSTRCVCVCVGVWVCGCVCVRACVRAHVCLCILNVVHFFDVQQFKLGEAPSLKTVSEVVESAKDSDGSR